MLGLLLVDDETTVREALAEILIDDHYEVKTAGSGETALQILETNPIDLIISDLQMPGMNGVEFYQQVQIRWPGIPFILLSASPIDSEIEGILSERVRYLNKPFQVEVLLQMVAQLIDGSESDD